MEYSCGPQANLICNLTPALVWSPLLPYAESSPRKATESGPDLRKGRIGHPTGTAHALRILATSLPDTNRTICILSGTFSHLPRIITCTESLNREVRLLINRLYRTLPVIAVVLSALGAASQSKGDASIEAAVVKPHPSAVMHNNFSFAKNRFELEDQPLLKLIAFAYSLNPRQIVGASGWVSEDRWDMSGKTNLTDNATLPQQQQIVRQLLVESFGLQFHREKRELPPYALQVVKDQPRLAVAADPAAVPLEWTEGHDWVRTENYRSSSMADFLIHQAALHGPTASGPDWTIGAIRF